VISDEGAKIILKSEIFHEIETVDREKSLSDDSITEKQLSFYDYYRKQDNKKKNKISRIRPRNTNIFLNSTKTSSTKAPSPDPREWAKTVSELSTQHFSYWKEICDYLNIDVGSDSGRRVLQKWVSENKPSWPSVPDP